VSGPSAIGRNGLEASLVRALTLVLILLLLAPIVTVVVISFTSGTTLQFPPPGLSLRWYEEIWTLLFGPEARVSRLGEAILVSLQIAGLAAIVCVLAGVPACYAISRYTFPGRALVEELLGLPIVFPAVVLGIALLVLVSVSGLNLGLFQIVIAHAIVGLPFLMRNCLASMRGIDPALEEAAKTLGAPGLRAFFEIVLPLSRGGIVSGALLVFILSFNEFTLSYFLYTVDVFPLSIWLFQQANTSFSPAVFAVSALLVVVNVAVILIVDAVASGQPSHRRAAS
jgi:putative spermidine/putrescine transport system permease protein